MKAFWLPIAFLPFLYCPVAACADSASALDPGLVNPGYHEQPQWFKQSFLDIRDDVAEAKAQNKRIILYFYQDGCPYCAKLLRENFADQTTVEMIRKHFDLVAINLWGDREVTGFLGNPTTEKAFAAGLKVQFTPTLLFLDEHGRLALRINGYFPPHKLRTAIAYLSASRQQQDEPVTDFYQAHSPAPAGGKLHQEGGFLSRPLRLADHQAQRGQALVVMFEQANCLACDELHQDILRREPIAYALSNLDGAIVDVFSTDLVQTPDRREMPINRWAQELNIKYTPSLVFFDASGKEVFRTEGYLKAFHIHGALDYVSTGAFARQPSFQRYLATRRAALEQRGFEIDLLE